MKNIRKFAALLMAAGLTVSAFAQTGTTPTGTPPSGSPPSGSAGSGSSSSSSSSSVTYYATYKLDGGTATLADQSYSATAADTSAVWVANSGVLTLTNPAITTSGNTSSQDNSSFYGLNAGLLVTSGSATVTGGTITTTGTGANCGFATGSSAVLSLSNMTLKASADGGHAVMATQGGKIALNNVNMVTTGGSSSAIATDRGSGTITVTGGNVTTSGSNSAGLYSTGVITVTGGTFKSTGAEAAVIEGANSITLTSTSLTSTKEKWSVLMYQSMSGDAEGTEGTFTMTGGSITYTPTSGPLFYNTNSTANIILKGVTVTSGSSVFLKAVAGSWGTSGSNGGTSIVTLDGQTLKGDVVTDSISSATLTLKNSSSLTGAINTANTAKATAITLDATSKWTVTANSYLTTVTDSAGISGTSITNIVGNGFTVYYDSTASGNSYLGAKTYTLSGGGTLTPSTGSSSNSSSSSSSAPTIKSSGVANAASGAAGIAPSAWISIFGTNFTTSSLSATTSDLVNGYLPTTLGGVSVTINGKSAYLNYVSPTQLNVQAPSDSSTGDVTVTVKNASGSVSTTAKLQATLPGLFTSSNYVLAIRASDSAVIDGTTVPSAKPGDVLSIYATGLGATTTAVDAGLVFSGAYATTSTPTVTIGGTAATVSYSGLVGAGLYQINLTVPSTLTAGTHAVIVTQGGVSSPSTAVLKVATE